MKTKKGRAKVLILFLVCAALIGVIFVFSINAYVKNTASDRILSSQEAANLSDVDCILVLGCQVKDDGTPSDMLRDRLTRGIEVYNLGAAPKLLMSGDHGREDYDEVGTMKQYAINEGIASESIFMDHTGFSTYESVYRAKEIFQADKIIIISQDYHLYRALYIAEKLGIEAYGVASDYHTYAVQGMRECREILARCKDWAMCIFKPEPEHLGDEIPVSGNGDLTNDK